MGDFAWSPDSKLIAFDAQRDPDLSSSDTSQIYVVDLADKRVKKLLDGHGPNQRPRWSPDGRQIAYETGNGEPFFFYANTRIGVVPIDGGEPRIVTADFDEDARIIDWGPGGIDFSAMQKGAAHVFRADPTTLAIRRITSPDSFFSSGASFTRDHRTMAAVGAMPNHFAEVFVSPVADFAPRYLTAAGEQWKDFKLTTREMIEWKSTRRHSDPRRAGQAAGLRSSAQVSAAGGDTRRSHRNGQPGLVGRPLLSGRALRGEGRAGPAAQLSRIGGVRREIPVAQRAQPRAGRLRGRHLWRRLPDREGHGGQGSRRRDGLERGRLHLGVHHLSTAIDSRPSRSAPASRTG